MRGMTWNHRRGRAPMLAVTESIGASIDWEARSLAEFEDTPVATLAATYDLLAIDHPHVGQAAASGALVALEEVLPAELLRELSDQSVGPSYRSYTWEGHQWALPMDAASQVSAYRPDLLPEGPPRTWDEVVDLAGRLPAGVEMRFPANPTHLWSSFLTLCHHHADADRRSPSHEGRPGWWPGQGIDDDVAVAAIELLYRLLGVAGEASLSQNPIQQLDEMAAGAPIAYAPLVFGYSNYSFDGYGDRLVTFADVPSPDGAPGGSMLGGVGLAVSARCTDLDTAVAFATTALSATFQAGEWVTAGGQPGHRAAWTDRSVNELTHDFYAATLATLDHSFVRGRDVGYPRFQQRAGELLHRGIMNRETTARLAASVNEAWRSR